MKISVVALHSILWRNLRTSEGGHDGRRNEFLLPSCTALLHNRLVCRHDIDHVINDEHVES
jgi:hypothetical protein